MATASALAADPALDRAPGLDASEVEVDVDGRSGTGDAETKAGEAATGKPTLTYAFEAPKNTYEEEEAAAPASVDVPSTRTSKDSEGEFTQYEVTSTNEAGKVTRVWRRYRQFVHLQEALVEEGHTFELPPKRWFGNMDAEVVEERRIALATMLRSVLDSPARDSAQLQYFVRDADRPDWPAAFGPIDLAVHDRPHESSATEWWYYNSHLKTSAGREFSAFVCFFRVVKHIDRKSGRKYFAHALNWAITDVENGKYYQDSLLDNDSPAMIKKIVEREGEIEDPRLKKAMMEVLEKGNVPLPDRMFNPKRPTTMAADKLAIDFEDATVTKDAGGRYVVKAALPDGSVGLDLVFDPAKPAIRHGLNGVVKGHNNDDMFYYFIPRCGVSGGLTVGGRRHGVSGSGWYDHEFGGIEQGLDEDEAAKAGVTEGAAAEAETAPSSPASGGAGGADVEAEAEAGDAETKVSEEAKGKYTPSNQYAWNWAAVQLDNGCELTAAVLVDPRDGRLMETRAVVVDRDGKRSQPTGLTLEGLNTWMSVRTFSEYPTQWRLRIPSIGVDLHLSATFEDQEFMTVIAKPAFWEGRIDVTGTFNNKEVTGVGFVERNGFSSLSKLTTFFKGVGKTVRAAVQRVYPDMPTYEEARLLVADDETDRYMEGVPLDRLQKHLLQPVREIADRGGKSWRSYSLLACVDCVGGESRDFIDWLAMPEFMHVGSLVVDDIQDRSETRRGGPCAHLMYGEAICINAGTAAYFQGQKMLALPNLDDKTMVRVYDMYFMALRAGHAGQALDISGLDYMMDDVVATGDISVAEERILAIHRLKTAAPAGQLARMGAVAGHGAEEQVEAIGEYFEAVGLAFQIMDDVLNLRGLFTNEADRQKAVMLKNLGEDITCGKVTIPVVKAMGLLKTREEREELWRTVASKPSDPVVVQRVIDQLEGLGAIEDCVTQATELVESAWAKLDPIVPDAFCKIMLRSFGWFVIERTY